MALTLRQSQPFADAGDLDEELERASRRLAEDPELVPDEWMSYAVRPHSVEFWQGDPTRRHRRLRYERTGVDEPWVVATLWP